MISASIELRGFQIVRKSLEDFSGDVVKISYSNVYETVWGWRNELSHYPPPYAGSPPFEWAEGDAGIRQRRYVMWALKNGEIEIPYKRTGRYGWNWRVKRDRSVGAQEGVTYTLYNGVTDKHGRPYAVFVAGGPTELEEQALIHIGRWLSLYDAARAVELEVEDKIVDGVASAARRRGLS